MKRNFDMAKYKADLLKRKMQMDERLRKDLEESKTPRKTK